jgi:hypothetical protein
MKYFKRFIFRAAAILLGFLIAVVIVEIFARLFYREPWHNHLEREQHGSESYSYKRNKYDLRGDDFVSPKPPDCRRILILGDSFTFGLGVPDIQDTFPKILETELNKEIPINGVKKIEILNGGKSGSLPRSWLELYRMLEDPFDPDVVLVVFFLRDGTSQKTIPDFFKNIRSDITLRNSNSWFYQKFYAYRIIRDTLDRSNISSVYTRKLKDGYFGDEKQTRVWQHTQRDLRLIKLLTHKNSEETGFVIFPILASLDDNYPFKDICNYLEEFAKAQKFSLHNLLPSFLGFYAPNLWVTRYDQHPNAKGHRIAAQSLLPFVKDLLILHNKRSNQGFYANQQDSNGDRTEAAPSPLENLWFEAESANTVVSPLEIAADEDASNGRFLYAPNGSGSKYSLEGTIMATYNITVPKAGEYVLWGRVWAPSPKDDSFFIQIDDGIENLWEIGINNQWSWDKVNDRGILDPVSFKLTEGAHTIMVKLREDGTQIDKLLLTNQTAFVPVGKGPVAEIKGHGEPR